MSLKRGVIHALLIPSSISCDEMARFSLFGGITQQALVQCETLACLTQPRFQHLKSIPRLLCKARQASRKIWGQAVVARHIADDSRAEPLIAHSENQQRGWHHKHRHFVSFYFWLRHHSGFFAVFKRQYNEIFAYFSECSCCVSAAWCSVHCIRLRRYLFVFCNCQLSIYHQVWKFVF